MRNCLKMHEWNGYICRNEDLGVLLFESQDADNMDRASQPIYVTDWTTGFRNKLNAYMDKNWDGAYTSQKRLQRFPSLIDSSRNYTIEYTGTPPFKQKFTLFADEGASGTLLTIPYPDAGAYKVYNADRTLAIPTDWDHELETWAVPTGKYCGENRFLGVFNRLSFWIEPGCTLYIVPRDAIMLAIRLEWTLKKFFQKVGIAKFTDRMTA